MKKYSLELDLLPSFKEWDLPWAWCWGVIAGIILIIVPSFNTGNSMFFYAIGSNLLIVFGSVYLVLGLSVLWGIFERFNLKNSMKIIIIAAIFLFFGLFIFLPVLGLADIWINFRRLKRVQK
jgi:Kef-type K+ transport system membrane component KefB